MAFLTYHVTGEPEMVRPVSRVRRRRGSPLRTALTLTACIGLFLVSGCGLLSGSEGKAANQGNGNGLTTITVGTMPAVDVAPLHLAIQNGYFEQAGLKLDLQTISGGAQGIPKLANGSLDVTFGNWVSFFRAQQKGVVDLKAISDAYQAAKGTFLLMRMPGKGITSPERLQNEKIAVNTRANINELLTITTLKPYGLTPGEDYEFVTMDFPDMPSAVQRGDVAAASVIEPFISQANKLGAETLLDTASGPTANMPIAGYAATQKWVENHRGAAAKFQRVMSRAQQEAGADRNKVEKLLPTYTKIDPETAPLVQIGTYPTTLDASRLQRVVGLMKANGELPQGKFDVESMLFHAPPAK
ncbi:ABC transporter substrate-binding protein [Haloactinomyces albus]|uniref:NitT/TauT family transport system substrate-binding protein n=1 Tax=Haloactinomyces albus TaxID=1352928 RepID=A0AAE3ZDG7_9ACTN|nr:ABC transporter substrate-binding protein [Haloactinomyces albus]MDR7301534.1 NitT/TauT family transport system substrate-binding protein [Haloactinomyces albus]